MWVITMDENVFKIECNCLGREIKDMILLALEKQNINEEADIAYGYEDRFKGSKKLIDELKDISRELIEHRKQIMTKITNAIEC